MICSFLLYIFLKELKYQGKPIFGNLLEHTRVGICHPVFKFQLNYFKVKGRLYLLAMLD